MHHLQLALVKITAAMALVVISIAGACIRAPVEGSSPSMGVGGYRFVTSVDTMKESKDAERNGLTNAQIADDVNLSASLNTTHVTVDTRMEYPGVMAQWVAAVRNAGKHVWFRLGSDNCAQSRSSYLAEMQNLILSNPAFFRGGDIFDGDAEAENSCYWYNNCGTSGPYNCPSQFNAFLQNLTAYADSAFSKIGVSGVITWIHSTDPGTATDGLLNAATVSADHNTVTVDPYPDGSTTDPTTAAGVWLKELQEFHSAWPSATIVIGESGYCLKINVSDATQHAVLSAEYTAIENAGYPWIAGWNYWVGAGGAAYGGYTNLFTGSTGSWSLRPAAADVSAFYAVELGLSRPGASSQPAPTPTAAPTQNPTQAPTRNPTQTPVANASSASPSSASTSHSSTPPARGASPTPLSAASPQAYASRQPGRAGTDRIAAWMLVGGMALILAFGLLAVRIR